MLEVFGSLKALMKPDAVVIDNAVFRMHCRGTLGMLIAFCLLVSARQYVGDPIDCIVNPSVGKVIDTYCWIHGTFILPDKLDGEIGVDVAHPGVSTFTSNSDKVRHVKYYPWVPLALLFQALLFYIPRYLWKHWEGGKVGKLLMGLDSPIVDVDERCGRKKQIVEYMHNNIGTHDMYAFRFVCCEIWNLVNVVGQMYLMDMFLGYEFSTYGSDVLAMIEEDTRNRVDPMAKIFPTVTKCAFSKYGPTGEVETYDALCVLALNAFNQMIYLVLWYWFNFVSFISGISFIFRLASIFVPRVRGLLLQQMSRLYDTGVLEEKMGFGDWFLLYQLGKNMDPITFRELVEDLATRFDGLDEEDIV